MSSVQKDKKNKLLWLAIAFLTILLAFVLIKTQFYKPVAVLSEKDKAQVSEIEQGLKSLDESWTEEIVKLNETKQKLIEASESFRLTELLISTFQDFQKEIIDLKKELVSVKDSTGIRYCKEELIDLQRAWEGSKKLINEHRKLLGAFSLIMNYENRIDSLKTILSNEVELRKLSVSAKQKLEKEIKDYEEKLNRLKIEGYQFKEKNDSLAAVSVNQARTIDSLTNSLEKQRKAYDELVQQAKKNAEFANKLSLWYFEKDNKNKPKRRQLTSSENDLNKSSEIRAINGEFSLSAELYEPFQVATIVLSSANTTQKTALAQVQISVRDQVSGEFVLIPESKLEKGKYLVEVYYLNQVVLKQNFYVNK